MSLWSGTIRKVAVRVWHLFLKRRLKVQLQSVSKALMKRKEILFVVNLTL